MPGLHGRRESLAQAGRGFAARPEGRGLATDVAGETGGVMPSVFEVLRHDHEEVQQMLSELESGPTAATAAGADQLALRKKMAETLIIEESRHEAPEEVYFWPPVPAPPPHAPPPPHHAPRPPAGHHKLS